MPLTKSEAVQLKAAIWKCQGINLANSNSGPMISKAHTMELIDAYTEETIKEIEAGTRKYEFLVAGDDG